jgi:hypothetical protein
MTKIILGNTAGTLPIEIHLGIGKGRVVVAIMVVVQSVSIVRVCVVSKNIIVLD